MNEMTRSATGLEIAVIGMAGRFPEAGDIDTFWRNLEAEREGIRELDPDVLRAEGVDEATLADAAYVRAGGVLDDADCFDAAFFGYSPREAELLDPQQRVFLECAWHALEDAGYPPGRDAAPVGVFGGAGMNGYLLSLYGNADVRRRASPYELFIGNDKDFLTTRVSYKLDLTGPSIAVQTACSSSLVAVHLACQSLISGECDMAMAGGVAVTRQVGYRAVEGGIHSPDGRCRAFDADAAGTVSGNGVGIVVLKRLDEALTDRDRIDAVILGSAVNNDGGLKVSYTAPQVDHQVAVIRDALAMADVDAGSVSYIEAHGTGTPLGDPIEITALTHAFRADTQATGFCALGSVKTNIGHLDAAAGIAGLIKTVLALKHRRLPASLHFRRGNPQIDFAATPFRVNTETRDWSVDDGPLRAGVSSFGIGGTNAHVVLERAPASAPRELARRPQLLPLSARTEDALERMAARLAEHLESHPDDTLADVAFTLQAGRRALPWRATVTATDTVDAAARLRGAITPTRAASAPSAVFLFPGQGSRFGGAARSLYATEPAFRAALDTCIGHLDAAGVEVRGVLLDRTDTPLDTATAQPALFALGYALAELWRDRRVAPIALLGHSLGELVAACVAGVFTLESALALVIARGRLMQACEAGEMLAVPLAPERIDTWLDGELALAAHNGPELCAVSGPGPAIAALAHRLRTAGIATQRLHTSHGFHSPAMQPAVAAFTEAVSAHPLTAPRVPFVSCITGTWISDAEATNPAYWGRQLREPVRFDDGLRAVLSLDDPVLLELGPGNTLTTLATGHAKQTGAPPVTSIPTLPGPLAEATETGSSAELDAAGRAWCAGLDLDWARVRRDDPASAPRRARLPGYPFARDRYRIRPDHAAGQAASARPLPTRRSALSDPEDLADWFHVPTWRRQPLVVSPPAPTDRVRWLLFADERGIAERLVERIEHAGQDAFRVVPGDGFAQGGYRTFRIAPADPASHRALFADLVNRDTLPEQIVWLWPLRTHARGDAAFAELLALVRVAAELADPVQITIVTAGATDASPGDVPVPDQAALVGLATVIGQEYPKLGCRLVDLDAAAAADSADALWRELRAPAPPARCAWRLGTRWIHGFAPLSLPDPAALSGGPVRRLRKGGSFAIVGDIDHGLGQIWARALVDECEARVALIDLSGAKPQMAPEWRQLEADPAAPDSVAAALAEAVEHNGPLSGVFYSSPMTSSQSAAPLALLKDSHLEVNRRRKVDGLLALSEALAAHRPGFVCVQSSMSSVLGGLGLAAYAAANHRLEAQVAARNASGDIPWFAINWDAVRHDDAAPAAASLGASLADHALSPTEVWRATERIVTVAPPGQIAVSRTTLAPRLAEWVRATPRSLEDRAVGARPKAKPGRHERPDLSTAYVGPRDEVERTVARIWQEALGIDEVGVDDNFFQLGGHSLLAIQVIGRLRDAFPIEIELQQLLEDNPTVANVAASLRERLPRGDGLAAMAELLDEITADEPQGGRGA